MGKWVKNGDRTCHVGIDSMTAADGACVDDRLVGEVGEAVRLNVSEMDGGGARS